MDQLRVVISWLRRHHFWVLVVVSAAVAVGCWYRGASGLYAEFVRNKQTIQAEFTKQTNLRNEPFHANDQINERQRTEIEKQRERVDALWRQLYERQRAEVLEWPSNLSEEFHRYIEKRQFGETVRRDLRDHYNQYIGNHFPELPKIVGALDMTSATAGGDRGGYSRQGMRGRGGPGGMPMEGGRDGRDRNDLAAEEEDFIVEWLDQQRIRDELYMPTTPSSKWIWVTQEDLWVYEALLQIVARTNEAKGADRFSNAAVRTIISLEVGRLAAQASRGRGRMEIPSAPGDAGAGMMGQDMMAMERGGMEYERGGMAGEMGYDPYGSQMEGRLGSLGGEPTGEANLFTSRYLDPDGKPITSTGDGGPEEFGKEFKRLPIRMVLEMDERWLPHLIAECANAPLQVEVDEVRVNPSSGLEGAGRSSGRRGGGDFRSSASGQSGESMLPQREPHIKPISIQGTIFIFNPPAENATSQQLADVQ